MGAVYEVLDLDTDRRRALKVMHAQGPMASGERWKREARIAGQIDSRFIVDVLDVGVDEAGARFLVMELLHGEDLSRRLARLGPLSAAEVALCLHQAALALDRMHRAGIIHRDLKPGNLFRDEREGEAPRTKILDFGIAIDGGSDEAAGNAGTPLYMAPEQLRGGAQVSAATDVYAIGMVAFALLAGRPYWADEWQRCGDKLRFALVAVRGPKEPASTQAARRGVALPPAFDAWFARATAADPQRRFPSAGAAARALGGALGVELPAEAPDAEVARPVAAPEGPGDTIPSVGERGARLDSTITAAEVLAAAVTGTDGPRRSPLAPRPWPARWRRHLVMAGVLVAAGLVIAPGLRGRRGAVAPAPRSPLEAPTSVLGCPVLEASGVEEPAGWLGAAAASLICERARLVLGGTTARTRVPAELLSLPREPTDDFPTDPYAVRGARERSLDAARRHADAYIDGKVTRDAAGFGVELVLHGGEAELARARGRGRALFEAVREAMQPLIDQDLLPGAGELDPAVREFSRARDPAAALALLDLSMAMVHNAGGLAEECARLDPLGDRVGEVGIGERFRCAYTLGLPLPDVRAPAAGDASPGAVATRARIRYTVQAGEDRQLAAEILRLFEAERSAWGRSVLGATASCLLQSSDPQRAAEVARRAVQAEPKNPTGELCAPWIQLVAVTRGTTSATSTARAMQAWAPWDSYSWMLDAIGQRDGAAALAYARRAYTLSPLDMDVARTLADKLLARGAREEVRGIALSLASGGYPVHRVAGDLLLIRVDASEARFRAALGRARAAMQLTPQDSGWVPVQRLDIAWRALEIAEILGGAATAELADLIVERFLDPEPPPLDFAHFDVPLRIPAICARASAKVAGRCFARFRALRGRISGGILPETDAFADGAERYARGDFHGAARAWRPLLKAPAVFAAVMSEAMATTFERTGEVNLVERLLAAVPDTSAELNGASLTLVRAARWAARRGERDQARALAQQVIEAWSVADEPVPAVEEMRRLLASLP
jgi:hypothetical protein